MLSVTTWVLEAEPWSSAREANALKGGVNIPAPLLSLYFEKGSGLSLLPEAPMSFLDLSASTTAQVQESQEGVPT